MVDHQELDSEWNQMKETCFNHLFECVFESKSEKLDEITKIYFNRQNYAKLYTSIYRMSTHVPTSNEYIYNSQLNYLETKMESIYTHLSEIVDEEELFRQFNLIFHNIMKIVIPWWSRFFVYLEFSYMKHSKVILFEDQIKSQFYEIVMKKIHEKMTRIYFKHYNMERETDQSMNTMIRDFSHFFKHFEFTLFSKQKFRFYTEVFEPTFLEISRDFYQKKSQTMRSSMNNIEYCNSILELMKKEKIRSQTHLFESSFQKMDQILIDKMIHLESILRDQHQGLNLLFQQDQKQQIQVLFDVIRHKEGGILEFGDIMKQFLLIHYCESIQNVITSSDAKDLNKNLLTFVKETHSTYSSMIYQQFENHTILSRKYTECMIEVMNKKFEKIQFTEQIAMYLDLVQRTLSPEEITENVNQLIPLTVFFHDKDIFMDYYRFYLSRRLLKKIRDLDTEIYCISKLKQTYGMQCTYKLEGMIHDYMRNQDDQNQFVSESIPYRCQIQNYTYGHFPNLPNTELIVPESLQHCMNEYTEFYSRIQYNRRLDWIYTFGNTTIQVAYPNQKSYSFVLNILQYVVFQLFMGHSNDLSFSQIMTMTKMNESYVKKVLHSLSCNKLKLLVKTPESNTIQSDDTFRFYREFSSPKRLNVIPCPVFEEIQTSKHVEEDRTHMIDAVIVRIMKSRRKLSHNELVHAILSDSTLLFLPKVSDIKKRIESLIERDYLERDNDNLTMYHYIA